MWLTRAEVLDQVGQPDEAINAFRKAIELKPEDAASWIFHGQLLQKSIRLEEAYQTYSQAIELAGTNSWMRTQALLNRSQVLKQLNRLPEALADASVAKISVRDPHAKPNLIDLTPFYNASLVESWHPGIGNSDLSQLAAGVQSLASVEFDVRGLIQVGFKSRSGEEYPKAVNGIAMGRECRRLHFLHSAIAIMSSWSLLPEHRLGTT